ncbi:MAG: hypothetical protein ABR980_11035 [Ignavibacteriaceae bacterium]
MTKFEINDVLSLIKEKYKIVERIDKRYFTDVKIISYTVIDLLFWAKNNNRNSQTLLENI